MNAAERILAGEDIDAVLDEQGPPTTMQNIGTAISKLSDFVFSRGTLAKVAGTGSGTPSPPFKAASGSVPGMQGKSLAQLAQDSASRSLTKPTVTPAVPAAPATKPATRPASESLYKSVCKSFGFCEEHFKPKFLDPDTHELVCQECKIEAISVTADTRPDSAKPPSLKPAANPLKGLTKHLRATPVGRSVSSESFVRSLIQKVQEGSFDWQELERMYGADFTPSGGLKGPGYEEKPEKPEYIVPRHLQGLHKEHHPHAKILHSLGWQRAKSDHPQVAKFTHEDFPTHSVELHVIRDQGREDTRWMMLHHPDPHEHADLIADGMTADSLGTHLCSMDYDTGSS